MKTLRAASAMRSCRRPAWRARPAETGSAYITALLVLVVLTIIGLGLVLITQIESQIGANEMTINRTLYAADSGIAVGLAKVLTSKDTTPTGIYLNVQQVPSIRDEVAVSGFLPIADAPCNLCQINQGAEFLTVNHLVGSTATRRAPGADVPIAQRQVNMMVAIQPWQGDNESSERADSEGNEGSRGAFDPQ
jgi:Tfp pilus assembly protein PilX